MDDNSPLPEDFPINLLERLGEKFAEVFSNRLKIT
jgi:hypothetical protein